MVYKKSAKPSQDSLPSGSLNEWVTELVHLEYREGVGPGHLFHLLHHLPVGDLYHKPRQSEIIKQFSYKNIFT
jgi:hypothetical protein